MKSIHFTFIFIIFTTYIINIAQSFFINSFEGTYNIIINNNEKDSNEKLAEKLIDEFNKMISLKKDTFENIDSLEKFGKKHEVDGENKYIYKVADDGQDIWLIGYLNPQLEYLIKRNKNVVTCEPNYHIEPNQKIYKYKCRSEVLGYPCCPPEVKEIVFVDTNGDWGKVDGEWCGFTPYFESNYHGIQ